MFRQTIALKPTKLFCFIVAVIKNCFKTHKMLIEAKKFKTDVIDYTRSLESNTNSCALNFI